MQVSGHDFKKDLRFLAIEMRHDDEFAKELYAAMCNMRWRSKVTDEIYSCSWRFAGGLVAEIRGKGERYIDFYCSGGEGTVTERIKEALDTLGWEPCPWTEADDD